ncbi:MAG TPA: CBS domain-containing protein [Candidatus Bathyarchaeota archaeon]|nr:CBS domain-containing protein [Candidatus Bathyarchaeota archaeon]
MVITGKLIRRLRIAAGLTQRQLAELAGVSQAHIAKIELGKVDPRLSTVNRILEVLTEIRGPKCKDVMTRDVKFVRPGTTVREVSELMTKYAIDQLPVIDEHGRVVGTVTDRCIVKNLKPEIANEVVENIMEPPLPCVPEDTGIDKVRILLEEYPGVLVMRGKDIVGIITRSDLIKTITSPLEVK